MGDSNKIIKIQAWIRGEMYRNGFGIHLIRTIKSRNKKYINSRIRISWFNIYTYGHDLSYSDMPKNQKIILSKYC